MSIPAITLVSGVVISPDNDNTSEASAILKQATSPASFQGKSIGSYPILHLWLEKETVVHAEGQCFTFGFRALLAGHLAPPDPDCDNVELLEDVTVKLADNVTFYMLRSSPQHQIIPLPHQPERCDG